MLSPFVQRKVTLAYYRWDQTKDGLLSGADYEQVGRRVAEHLELPASSDAYNKIVSAYRNAWDQFTQASGADRQSTVTLQDYLAALGQLLQHPAAAEYAGNLNLPILAAIDLNGDGRIERREWQVFLRALEATDAEAQSAFQRLDRDGNGTLSTDELNKAIFEYYSSEDPSAPGNYLFGRL